MAVSRRAILMAASAGLAAPMLASRVHAQSLSISRVVGETARTGQLRTLIVWRDNRQVFAEAFRGPALDQPANIKSASKTMLALLTGIALDRGVIEDVDQPVLPLLGHGRFGDPRDGITISDLLTMRAGLSSTSGADYGAWASSPDWVEFALMQPLKGQPGRDFIYSTGNWHILGAALARASGMDLHRMMQNWLGTPLKTEIPPWITDPQGRYLGGNDMSLSPDGLARIGRMVLNGGELDGHRVLRSDWIRQSWQPKTRSPFSGDEYGYGWYLARFGGRFAAYARGYGGQMLVVQPERRLVIALTSDPDRPATDDGYFGTLRALVDAIAKSA